jgi:hypothetical protein
MNPVSGLRLTASQLVISPELRPKTFLLADIDAVKINGLTHEWSDATSAALLLRDGTRVDLFNADFPKPDIFEAELNARGVAVIGR